MMRCLILGVCLLFFVTASGGAETPIKLERVKINVQDRASLLRGAKFFATNCMTCHTMKYLAHNELAQEAGITLDKMPLKNKEWWLDIVPPDLSLIVSQRGADWVFTYLHSFYKDTSRPTGYNNLLIKNSNMTNILVAYQGQQELTSFGKRWLLASTHKKFRAPPYYRLLELIKAGSQSPEEFNQAMTDLVNFLAYASEPNRIEREHLGFWVLLFFAIFAVIAYFLKKSFWRDVE